MSEMADKLKRMIENEKFIQELEKLGYTLEKKDDKEEKEKRYLVIGDYDYIMGHLRYGHSELYLDEEGYEKFKRLSKSEQVDYLDEVGNIVVDDYSLEDAGNLSNIEIREVK